jgi:hypothetical protein
VQTLRRVAERQTLAEESDAQLLARFVADRRRLSDPRRYRVFDSMDICQSVIGARIGRTATAA